MNIVWEFPNNSNNDDGDDIDFCARLCVRNIPHGTSSTPHLVKEEGKKSFSGKTATVATSAKLGDFPGVG